MEGADGTVKKNSIPLNSRSLMELLQPRGLAFVDFDEDLGLCHPDSWTVEACWAGKWGKGAPSRCPPQVVQFGEPMEVILIRMRSNKQEKVPSHSRSVDFWTHPLLTRRLLRIGSVLCISSTTRDHQPATRQMTRQQLEGTRRLRMFHADLVEQEERERNDSFEPRTNIWNLFRITVESGQPLCRARLLCGEVPACFST